MTSMLIFETWLIVSCLLEQMLSQVKIVASVKDYDPRTVFIYDNYSEWASTAIVCGDCDPWVCLFFSVYILA